MDVATFIFLNLVFMGAFVYGRSDKEYSFIMNLISGIFGLFIVLGVLSGINTCFNCSSNNNYDCEILELSSREMYIYGNNFTDYHWEYDDGTVPPKIEGEAFLFHRNTTKNYEYVCFEKTKNFDSLGFIIKSAMVTFYLVCSLGLFVLASVTYKNKDFKGGY